MTKRKIEHQKQTEKKQKTTHVPGKFSCEKCGRTYNHKSGLSRHRKVCSEREQSQNKEKWFDVVGYDNYQVTKTGRFRNKYFQELKVIQKRHVIFTIDGKHKTFLRGILVAQTFLENPEQKQILHYKDHNIDNYNVNNLMWVTRDELKQLMPKDSKGVCLLVDKATKEECFEHFCHLYKKYGNKAFSVLALPEHNKLYGRMNYLKLKMKDFASRNNCLAEFNESFGNVKEKMTLKEVAKKDELWRVVPNFPEYYVSNFGRVYSVRYQRLREMNAGKKRYITLTISNNKGEKVTTNLHRLVATIFLSEQKKRKEQQFLGEKLEVNHIDGNKSNCRADNLIWMTHKENAEHARDTGLVNKNLLTCEQKVQYINEKGERGMIFDSVKLAAKHFHIHRSAIHRILSGKEKPRITTRRFKNNIRGKKVGENRWVTYKHIRDAATKLSVCASSITKQINGKKNFVGDGRESGSSKYIFEEIRKRKIWINFAYLECEKLSDEVWKIHPVYTNYKISTKGRVINTNNNHLLGKSTSKKKTRYKRVKIIVQSKPREVKSMAVHRLVSETFLQFSYWLKKNDYPSKSLVVNHRNHDTKDNRLINLEWCTQKENCNR